MIKFFRKIRFQILGIPLESSEQKSLKEGNLKRYIVYAFGEILLVMIGILLALQINNWNETKKELKREIKLLSQLEDDLENNLDQIKNMYNSTLERSVAKDSILKYLPNAEKHKDELKMYLHSIQLSGVYNLAHTTYKSIEAGGIDALSNDSLRTKITDMYEFDFRNIEYRTKLEYDITTNRLKPLVMDHLVPTPVSPLLNHKSIFPDIDILNYPKDPTKLSRNTQFINALTELQVMTTARKAMQEKTMMKLQELILELEEEITRLKK